MWSVKYVPAPGIHIQLDPNWFRGGEVFWVDVAFVSLFGNSFTYITDVWLWVPDISLGSYFHELECHICEQTTYIGILQGKSAFYIDLDGEVWVKCSDCYNKFHANCVLHAYNLTSEQVEDHSSSSSCIDLII